MAAPSTTAATMLTPDRHNLTIGHCRAQRQALYSHTDLGTPKLLKKHPKPIIFTPRASEDEWTESQEELERWGMGATKTTKPESSKATIPSRSQGRGLDHTPLGVSTMAKRKVQHDPYKQKSIDGYISRTARPSRSKTTPKGKEVAQPPKPTKTQRKRQREDDDDDTDAARSTAQDARLTRSAKKRLDAGSSRHADEDDASLHESYTAGATDDDTGSVFELENYSDPEGDEEDMFLSSDDNEDDADQPDEDNEEEASQPDEDNEDEDSQFDDAVQTDDDASQFDDVDQTDDDADIHHADDDDMREAQYSLNIPLRDKDLFNIDVTSNEVTSMVEKVLPALSSRKMKNFYRTIAGHLEKSPPFRIPARSRHPTTWSLVNPDFDLLWKHAVDGERALDLGDASLLPKWLNMSEDGLVKPVGSFTDTLPLISSYPTASDEGSVHNRYGTVDDMSNVYLKFCGPRLMLLNERILGKIANP
ncbi:uncharacterized protein J4E79_003150 [Alternaria viburni]|uniref:uncharacterized protein n=1 Tax=Alternaria viburni TaxID=566460 RepID=UPI0020C33D75|nr:uncharacterized protein J4E79_003150 [Alternaria viburni]KAI4664852.1 hypothetical protein J4E79_003150 [Alternaria viburni]